MGLSDILIFATAALLIRLIVINEGRRWLIFLISVLAVFWLQPATPIRYLDFWLPVATLGLVVLIWLVFTPVEARITRQNGLAFGTLLLVILLIGLTRLLSSEGILTRTRPPQFSSVLIFIALFLVVSFLLIKIRQLRPFLVPAAVGLVLCLFVVLKVPQLAENASITLRMAVGQSAEQASALDIRWLGFSYLAFRLLHVLRDVLRGRGQGISLRDFVSYTVFFPAFTAGPIDRLERFSTDLQQPPDPSAAGITAGGRRLVLGLLKKFVLADALALLALNPINAGQVTHAGWGWVILYGYSFQILLDFSGYTDIAIGIALWMGIRLPENFNRPYLQENLGHFWNNWHMTLTNWFRAYFFNPLTRALRKDGRLSPTAILFLTQLGTMLLIGMWHGVSWNFLIWGAWHGLGLFLNNRWSDWTEPLMSKWDEKSFLKGLRRVVNVFLTYHYVTLGWIWFVLPDPAAALSFIAILFSQA